MSPLRHARPILVALAAAASGCHHRVHDTTAMKACEPAAPQPAAEMSVPQLIGSYAVTFVATEGPKAGRTVRGRLVLRAQNQSLVHLPFGDSTSSFTQPVVGAMDLATDSIGATRMGDLMAADGERPGVGVYVTSRDGQVSGILARVGSGSNGRSEMVIDGGYFTLYVARVGPNGIWGGWRSSPGTGGMVTPDAVGHFCAEKLPT